MDDAWGTIEQIVNWLDKNRTLPPDTEKLLRIMKLTEEAGEVTQAVIGALGQNPRRRHLHLGRRGEAELCDVILTAMVALTTLTPDARQTFESPRPVSPSARSASQAPIRPSRRTAPTSR